MLWLSRVSAEPGSAGSGHVPLSGSAGGPAAPDRPGDSRGSRARSGVRVLPMNTRHLRLPLVTTLVPNFCLGRSRLQPREGESGAEEPSCPLGDATETQGALRHGKTCWNYRTTYLTDGSS